MPVYADVNGDGVPDYYGLDMAGRLEYRFDASRGTNIAAEFGETGSEGP